MGVKVLPTPVRAPKGEFGMRALGGSMRGGCLDYLIPFNERHLRFVLKAWIAHFNSARPHMSLGPGMPSGLLAPVPFNEHRHRIPDDHEVRRVAVLGGLHHEYRLEKVGLNADLNLLRTTASGVGLALINVSAQNNSTVNC